MTEYCDKTMLLIAQKVRAACVQASLDGYQNAAMSGLCHEGACEASISAIRMIDLEGLIINIKDQDSDDVE